MSWEQSLIRIAGYDVEVRQKRLGAIEMVQHHHPSLLNESGTQWSRKLFSVRHRKH